MVRNWNVKIKRTLDWKSILGFILALSIMAIVVDKCRTQQTQRYIENSKFETYIIHKIDSNLEFNKDDIIKLKKYIQTK